MNLLCLIYGCSSLTFSHDSDPGKRIRDADSGRDERESHDCVRDAEGEPDHRDHPDHHVRVQRDPDNGGDEGGHVEAGHLRLAAV